MVRSSLFALLLLPALSWGQTPISVVDSDTGNALNGGDVTLTLTSLAENDLVVICAAQADEDQADKDIAMTTGGYTEVFDIFQDDATDQDTNLAMFYKFMGATPDTTATVNFVADGPTSSAAAYYAFRGVDLVTPLDVTTTTATHDGTGIPNPPSIDWSTNDTAVGYCAGNSSTTVSSIWTAPTGYTNIYDSANDSDDVSVVLGYDLTPAADPEDPGILSWNRTDDATYGAASATFALRDASPSSSGIAPIRRHGR